MPFLLETEVGADTSKCLLATNPRASTSSTRLVLVRKAATPALGSSAHVLVLVAGLMVAGLAITLRPGYAGRA